MKIILIHNFYQQPGGEDIVFEQERRLLEGKGHHVVTYTRSNQEVESFSAWDRVRLLKTIVSAKESRDDIKCLLREERPDVVHIHNTLMMVSPGIYKACIEAGVPTVQTLHNYRLLCPATTLYRNGKVCEECIRGGLLRGIQHGCYRDSRAATAAVALMLGVHRVRGTWTKDVSAFVALTEFSRQKFVDNGLPGGKVYVKPNFVDPDPGERAVPGDYALFVGRLSPEKGVSNLLDAWKLLRTPLPLKIAGDGPARAALEAQARRCGLRHVEFLGRLDRSETCAVMKGSAFGVMPSLWYEGFPLVLAESFACGVPVLGSRLGAMEEIIEDGSTGLHFTPGDPVDLAKKVDWAQEHPDEMTAMGRRARQQYEARYTAETNYSALMKIYGRLINKSKHDLNPLSVEHHRDADPRLQ